MKSEFEPEDIQAIATAVSEMLKPVISGNSKYDSDDRWFNVKQLSEYIGMSSQWIYNNKKNLPHVNINSKPLFKKSEVDRWFESFRVNAGNEVVTFPLNTRKENKGLQISGFNNQKRKAVTSL